MTHDRLESNTNEHLQTSLMKKALGRSSRGEFFARRMEASKSGVRDIIAKAC